MTSIGAWIERGAQTLRDAAIDAPRADAVRIAAAILGQSVGEVRLRDADEAPPEFGEAFLASMGRRAGGEPLVYVCGETGFRQLTLRCDARALIPRPETEQLVELALDRQRFGVAADIGTGTGCIALSLAFEGHFERVLAVDCSDAALELAQLNRARVPAGGIVELRSGDLTHGLETASVDLLVSNPPYLTEQEWQTLDASVQQWEPKLALPSGEDGLAAIRVLVHDGLRVVRAGGWLALEVDCRRAQASAAMARDGGWTDVAVHHDLFGRERFVLARRPVP